MLPCVAGELSAEPTEGTSCANAALAPSGPPGHLPRVAGEDLELAAQAQRQPTRLAPFLGETAKATIFRPRDESAHNDHQGGDGGAPEKLSLGDLAVT